MAVNCRRWFDLTLVFVWLTLWLFSDLSFSGLSDQSDQEDFEIL